VLAVLSPLLGGLLMASSVGFLISDGLALLASKQDPVPSSLSQFAELFPPQTEAWISSCMVLLGAKDSFLNIAIQCGLTLIGVALHSLCNHRRAPAVVIVIVGILGSVGWGLWSLGCKLQPLSCPATASWKWLISGSILWLLFAALSISRHLGILERIGNDFRVPFYMRRLKQAKTDWILPWSELTDRQRDQAMRLGWSREKWTEKINRPKQPWQDLDWEQRNAAAEFGWTQASWDTALWLEDGNQDASCREILLADYSRCTSS